MFSRAQRAESCGFKGELGLASAGARSEARGDLVGAGQPVGSVAGNGKGKVAQGGRVQTATRRIDNSAAGRVIPTVSDCAE